MPATAEHMREMGKRSNKVRTARAEIKRRIKDGEMTVEQVVRLNPEILSSGRGALTVSDILTLPKRTHRATVDRFLAKLGISPTLTLAALSPPRRKMLGDRLADR